MKRAALVRSRARVGGVSKSRAVARLVWGCVIDCINI